MTCDVVGDKLVHASLPWPRCDSLRGRKGKGMMIGMLEGLSYIRRIHKEILG